MNCNIFIVASPLQVMNAIEAIEYFKTQNNILLVLYTGSEKPLSQIKKMLNFSDWDTIKYILLPLKIVDKIVFSKKIDSSLKFIEKNKIAKLFVGEYRSDHVNHIVNSLTNQNIYLLDDGLSQLNYHKEIGQQSTKVKALRVLYKCLFYKLKPIKYTFFTMFDIENEKIIKNNYTFFKKQIGSKKIENSIYFIGQPLVELGIMSKENHKKELNKIIDFYKAKEFIYILHRREEVENVKKLSIELNFKYKEFDSLIELEMINSKIIPSSFATFYSTAIVTLPSFILETEYRVFRSQDNIINKKFINNISNTYKELNKMGLKVEML
jgi:hypothetical protein